jgi:hypothetical protein
MMTREVPERIHNLNPQMRLIFVFRDPVERAYSAYCMMLKAGRVSENVDAVLAPGTRFIEEGCYFEHLNRLLKVFEHNQVECLLYDDLQSDPAGFVQDVYSHIGVDSSFQPNIINKKYHARDTRPRSQSLYSGLVQISKWLSKQSRAADKVIEFLRVNGGANLFHRMNRGPDFPKLTPEKKKHLAEYYRDDVKQLSHWMSRDVEKIWLRPYLEPDQ